MSSVEERMRSVFELHDLALAMRREVLKRAHPAAEAADIEARLRDWLLRSEAPRPRDGASASSP